jgi:hypothetical protein
MGAGTSFAFTTLDNDALRMRLSVGVLNVRVRTLDENEAIEVETPQATASILRPGNYRLEVNPDGTATVVKVSSGMLEARGSSNQSFVVRPQQVATLTGTDRLAITTATLGAPDSFDQWALERDQHEEYALSTEASRGVPEDTVGYEDLDNYGTWTSDPQYGYVWSPTNVAADWTPYRFGQYTYVSGWGWAWIDNSPWGFAPYHYGSWVTIGSRWCWVPGPRHGRPVVRPGLGRPSDSPRRGWHVPRPPRGYTVRSGVPASEIPRIGTRPGFVSTDDRDRREAWRERRDGTANSGTRFRTVPDPVVVPPTTVPPADDRRARTPRYDVPRNPRNEVRTYTPPASPRPAEPPRVEPPRAEPPRMEQPRRDGSRFTVSPPPRPASPPPAPPRPVQSQPAPSPRPVQSQPAPSQPQSGRNGGDRSIGGRPRTLER